MNAHPNSGSAGGDRRERAKAGSDRCIDRRRADQNLRDRWTDCKFFRGSSDTGCIQPGQAGLYRKVTSRLGEAGINIATMQVYRDERGGHAVMVIEVDQEVPRERIAALEQEEGIEKVIYLCLEE